MPWMIVYKLSTIHEYMSIRTMWIQQCQYYQRMMDLAPFISQVKRCKNIFDDLRIQRRQQQRQEAKVWHGFEGDPVYSGD